jgi:heme/copper-type cytochrome/quinol oxidase subunit 1
MHFLGVAGMPRRIPDYPDAYFIFNKIASWGSYVSAISSLFFFYVLFDAFSAGLPDVVEKSAHHTKK